MSSVIKILSSNTQNIVANGKENNNNKKNALKKSYSHVKRVTCNENENSFFTTTAVVKKTLNKIEEEKSTEIKEIVIDQQDEPLLKPNPRRFVLFPIQYHEVKYQLI